VSRILAIVSEDAFAMVTSVYKVINRARDTGCAICETLGDIKAVQHGLVTLSLTDTFLVLTDTFLVGAELWVDPVERRNLLR
jgi:hypothetical protein